MAAPIAHNSISTGLRLLALAGALSSGGCATTPLTPSGSAVVVVSDVNLTVCTDVGEIIATRTIHSERNEASEVDDMVRELRNRAGEMGGTHLTLGFVDKQYKQYGDGIHLSFPGHAYSCYRDKLARVSGSPATKSEPDPTDGLATTSTATVEDAFRGANATRLGLHSNETRSYVADWLRNAEVHKDAWCTAASTSPTSLVAPRAHPGFQLSTVDGKFEMVLNDLPSFSLGVTEEDASPPVTDDGWLAPEVASNGRQYIEFRTETYAHTFDIDPRPSLRAPNLGDAYIRWYSRYADFRQFIDARLWMRPATMRSPEEAPRTNFAEAFVAEDANDRFEVVPGTGVRIGAGRTASGVLGDASWGSCSPVTGVCTTLGGVWKLGRQFYACNESSDPRDSARRCEAFNAFYYSESGSPIVACDKSGAIVANTAALNFGYRYNEFRTFQAIAKHLGIGFLSTIPTQKQAALRQFAVSQLAKAFREGGIDKALDQVREHVTAEEFPLHSAFADEARRRAPSNQ